MASMDIFNGDAFSLQSLTKAINDTPYQPMRIGSLGLFDEIPIDTTDLSVERLGATLSLVPASARGSVPPKNRDDKKSLFKISTVRLAKGDEMFADEIQNVRAFGSETELETVQNKVNLKLKKLRRDNDTTIEYQRIGALKGQVLDSDGTTVLADFGTLFGLTPGTHAMLLNSDTTKVKIKAVEAKRKIEAALGGKMYRGARVFCSASFFDAFVGHPAVAKAYDLWLEGQFLRTDNRGGFPFADVIWEEYRGRVSNVDFIADGHAIMVPEGVADMFQTYYAPADYNETVNTMGLPYYARQEAKPMGRGIDIEAQSQTLSVNTQPNAVIDLTIS